MKHILTAAMIISASAAFAGNHGDKPNPPGKDPQGTSLGEVTRDTISENGGEWQGDHASDPEGDGRGNTGARTGLANVVERGNLGATIEAVDCDGEGDIPGACGD